MSLSSTEEQGRAEIVQIGRLLHQKGFIGATDGNISMRFGSDQLLVTPSGMGKGFVKPEQLIITDLEGQVIQASTAEGKTLRPSSEFPLHLEVYRQRPEVRAVVHAHPPVSIALTVAGLDLETPLLPEVVVVLGTVPTAPYATPGTPEGAEVIRKLVKTRDAILLDHHGVVAVGSSPEDAYLKLEKVEHAARIVLAAAQLGRVIPLDRDQVERLIEIREAYGLLQPGDREQLCTKAKSAEVTGLETLIRRIVTEVLDTQSS